MIVKLDDASARQAEQMLNKCPDGVTLDMLVGGCVQFCAAVVDGRISVDVHDAEMAAVAALFEVKH